MSRICSYIQSMVHTGRYGVHDGPKCANCLVCKMADRPVPMAEKRLMDVKLGELMTWASTKDFSPNGIIAAVRRGHDRYYNKYINVKKGGIGGVAMLLTGYVVLSYLWEYDHIKHDRWRKYH